MNFIQKIIKIVISGIATLVILSVFCLVYRYNMMSVPTETGAAVYTYPSHSLISNMVEGFSWNIMDDLGFNNVQTYEQVDVLLMGSSQIHATKIPQKESVTFKLDQMLAELNVYNVGQAGQTMSTLVYHMDNACEYFSPKYVVMDMNNLTLDQNEMLSVINGDMQEDSLNSQRSKMLQTVRNYIPAIGELAIELRNWMNRSDDENETNNVRTGGV